MLLGYQAVTFAVLAKVFAVREGMHPATPEFERRTERLSFEWGLLFGGLLLLGGAAGSADAFLAWRAQSFGNLVPSQMLRWVIPAAMAVVLGCQTILASFLLGVLTVGTRKDKGVRERGEGHASC